MTRNYPIFILFALLGVWLLIIIWDSSTWPASLDDVELFNRAQRYDASELWAELRRRQSWFDTYTVEVLLASRRVVPSEVVVSYFWDSLRTALRLRSLRVERTDQIHDTLHSFVNRKLLDVLRRRRP